MDAIGGNLDAYTGKETICFSVKALSNHVPIALDVLSDLVLNPVFADTDIERERGVILEEIKIDEDNPDVLVHEIFTQNFWKDQPLGKPILGTTKTVSGLQQPTLFGYHSERFRAGNMVFSAAGNLDHDEFVASVAEKFDSLPAGGENISFQSAQVSAPIILRNKRSLEQVQILSLGVPSPPITDENRYATLILNTVLGGGMSSRLFQTIREERGMAYSIYSDLSPYSDTGALCVFAGTSADKTLEMLDLVMAEFKSAEGNAAHTGRAVPGERAGERQHPSRPGKLWIAHVEPGAAGNVFPSLLQRGRGAGTAGRGDGGTGTGNGAEAFCFGTDCGDAAGEAGRAETAPVETDLLKAPIGVRKRKRISNQERLLR